MRWVKRSKVKLLKSLLSIVELRMRGAMDLEELPKHASLHRDTWLTLQVLREELKEEREEYKYWELPMCQCREREYNEDCIVHGGKDEPNI